MPPSARHQLPTTVIRRVHMCCAVDKNLYGRTGRFVVASSRVKPGLHRSGFFSNLVFLVFFQKKLKKPQKVQILGF